MASAPQPEFERLPNIPPPGMVNEPKKSKKGKVIPFPSSGSLNERDEREEKFEISRQRILRQDAERAAVAPKTAESYEAYVKRLEGMGPKPHYEVLKSWWDDNAGKQRETWKFEAAEFHKENSQKTLTADYWLYTEPNGLKVSKMVPGTLKEIS